MALPAGGFAMSARRTALPKPKGADETPPEFDDVVARAAVEAIAECTPVPLDEHEVLYLRLVFGGAADEHLRQAFGNEFRAVELSVIEKLVAGRAFRASAERRALNEILPAQFGARDSATRSDVTDMLRRVRWVADSNHNAPARAEETDPHDP
jgi:hypothetical protein